MESQEPSSRLIVKNIPKYLSEKQIQEKFQGFGTITDVKIMFKGKTNRQFCYIGFIEKKDAIKARDYMNDTYIDTRKIVVEYARTHSEDKSLLEKKEKLQKKKRHEKDESASVTKGKKKYSEFADFMDEMELEQKDVPKVAEKEVNLGKRAAPSQSKPSQNDEEVTGNRLYITNIPYILEKETLKQEFEKFGKVTECIIPRDSDYNSKGFAFITFEEEADAAKAIALADNTVVFGRIIHVKSASKPKRAVYENHGGNIPVTEDYAKSSFKKIKKGRFLQNLNDETNWNALFLNPNTVMDYVAKEYGIGKKDLMDREVENPGVKIAMMETKVIQETKEWMKNNNINLEVFETDRKSCKRSDRVLIVKNLKSDVSKSKLELLFSRYGDIKNLLLAPNNSIAIVELKNSAFADNCFEKLQEYQLNGAPIYLEYAPVDMIKSRDTDSDMEEEATENIAQVESKKATKSKQADQTPSSNEITNDSEKTKKNNQKNKEKGKQASQVLKELREDEDTKEKEELVKGNTIFVKNLNFNTDEAALQDFCHSNNFKNIKTCTIVRKAGKSKGFGFIEFYNDTQAEKCLRALQGKLLEGHALDLSISRPKKNDNENQRKETVLGSESTKLLIKNLDFAASEFELKELVRNYGEVKQVRMPTKMTGEHRGYAFVEFTSIEEAKSALAALSSTHFYGRKLVIEYARA